MNFICMFLYTNGSQSHISALYANEGFSPSQPQPIEPQPNKNIENIS